MPCKTEWSLARLLPLERVPGCQRLFSTIYPWATKISNREPKQVPKTYDSQANFQWTNNKIPCSFCTFETTKENIIWSLVIGKNILPLIKGKQTALMSWNSLTVTSAAEQLRFLIWKWCQMNNLTVFEKPSIRKSWLFLQCKRIRLFLQSKSK